MSESNSNYCCQLCGFENYSLLHDKARHGKTVHNYICNRCGFIFILPRPSLVRLEDLYKEGNFSQGERNLLAPDDSKFKQCENIARSRLTILEEQIDNQLWPKGTRKSILDVGCGTGSFLRLMRGCGWDVMGLEPDSVYAQASSKRYNLEIKSHFVEEFQPDNQFDMICSFHVIEHTEDPNSFLRNIHRLIVDEGYLFIECPSIDRWYGETIDFFFWDVHINTFSQKTLIAFLGKNGFKTVSWGWNNRVSGLWVLAKKDKAENLEVTWDDPQRIRRIVEKAIANQTKKKKVQKKPSLMDRGLHVLKNDPISIPTRISEKVQRRLGIVSKPEKVKPKKKNIFLDAEEEAIEPILPQTSQLKIAHLGVHGNVSNGGDTLLFPVLRWLFQTNLAPTSFSLLQVRAEVTQKMIDVINQHDALLIGGGGLLLSDTNPNNLSGWQWACPIELLEQIKVPIIVFAIGYNQFRGQSEFADIFNKNICKLVEKSSFFGLRNYGSIEALKTHLPEELHHKLIFQPCPTTVLSHFYPHLPSKIEENKPIISVNVAFDRHHLRFGDREDEILWGIAEVLLEYEKLGYKIQIFNHSPEDQDIHLWLKAKGAFFDEVNLFGVPPQTVIEEYSKVALALGMRGHAQMIPFGLNKQILSLISHDKLRFFLEDIGCPEWGVDFKDENFSEVLDNKINFELSNRNSIEKQLLQSQDKLWKITQKNLETVKKVLR